MEATGNLSTKKELLLMSDVPLPNTATDTTVSPCSYIILVLQLQLIDFDFKLICKTMIY